MTRKHYRLVRDAYYSSIEESCEPIDDFNVFNTFAQAKRALKKYFTDNINTWKYYGRLASKMTAKDVITRS